MSGLEVWLGSLQLLSLQHPPAVKPSAPGARPIAHLPQGAVTMSQPEGESSQSQSQLEDSMSVSPPLSDSPEPSFHCHLVSH